MCLGWVQAWKTLGVVVRRRQVLIFMIAYFIWSDALATTQNVSILYMDEKATDKESTADTTEKDSSKMILLAGGSLMGIVGVLGLMKFQQCLKLTNKSMLLGQLSFYALICAACAGGALNALNGIGYFLCMVPVVVMMGSLQANTRSLYSSLSPVGMEAAMFAFYSITDKGSSLVGAAVIAVVHTSSGSYLGVFWYCMLAFIVSAVLLYFVDVKQGMVDASKRPGVNEESSFTQGGPTAQPVGKLTE